MYGTRILSKNLIWLSIGYACEIGYNSHVRSFGECLGTGDTTEKGRVSHPFEIPRKGWSFIRE
jgi:hypothetical protein